MVTVKVALSIMGLLLSALVYTVTFAVVTCTIHGAKPSDGPRYEMIPFTGCF